MWAYGTSSPSAEQTRLNSMRAPSLSCSMWKWTSFCETALCSLTGTLTRPNAMAPLQMARGMTVPSCQAGATRSGPAGECVRLRRWRQRLLVVRLDARRQVEQHELERLLLRAQVLCGAAFGERHADRVARRDVDVAEDDAAAERVVGGAG